MSELKETAREFMVWAKFLEFLDSLSEEEQKTLWRVLKKYVVTQLVFDAVRRKFGEVMKEVENKYQNV